MRELKFRAWLDEHKQYIYFGGEYKEPTGRWGKGRCSLVGNNHIADLVINEDDSNKFFIVHKVECIEQYTGLKDKNGKEIYEGDIVEQFVFGVKTFKGKPCGRRTIWQIRWNEEECCFELHYLRGSLFGDSLMNKDDEFEVIGNIQENPELLEEE